MTGWNVLTVRLHKDDRVWIAHCLDLDLLAQGRSFSEALERVKDLIEKTMKTEPGTYPWGRLPAPDTHLKKKSWFRHLHLRQNPFLIFDPWEPT